MLKLITIFISLILVSFNTFSEDMPTYKDEIESLRLLLGKKDTATFPVYVYDDTLKTSNIPEVEKYKKKMMTINSNSQYMIGYQYFLRPDNNIILSSTYGYNHIFEFKITIENDSDNKKTYEVNKSNGNKSNQFFLSDLSNYLQKNGWNKYDRDSFFSFSILLKNADSGVEDGAVIYTKGENRIVIDTSSSDAFTVTIDDMRYLDLYSKLKADEDEKAEKDLEALSYSSNIKKITIPKN